MFLILPTDAGLMERVRTSTLNALVEWLKEEGAAPQIFPGGAAHSDLASVDYATAAINMDGEQDGSLALLHL